MYEVIINFIMLYLCPSCWLSDRDSHRIQYINDRISAATDLTTDTAEELQIANYGIGGQYEPHFDFARVWNLV